ncbi:MAG: PAS domain S-box protein [Flavobacteriales bacterium]
MSTRPPFTPDTVALEHTVLQAVMENAPLPMAQVEGPDHLVWSINPAFCRMLQRSAEELIGRPFENLFPQSLRSLALLDRVLRTGEGEAHVVIQGDEPNTIYGAFTCWPISAGDDRLQGLMIQVTETGALRQQSIAINEALLISALQQHELTDVADRLNVQLVNEIAKREKAEIVSHQLAAIVSFSDDAIIGKDLDGIISSWNSGAEKIFGYTAKEMVGSSIRRLIPKDRWQEEDHILGKIRLGESVQHFETLRQAKDGHVFNVSVTASPIKDATGKVIGASKVARDISARKQLELALEKTAKDLVEVDRHKSEFLATLAHELRNPLAPLRHGLDLLSFSMEDQATWDQTHGMMKRQLDHMVRLIDDLMDLSRISRGVIDLRKEQFDLRAVLEQAMETSRPLIEKQGHTCTLEMPDEPITVDGDTMRLNQVFCNLLNNAAKYTDSGGTIAVHAQVSADEVCVTVEDNGIGIAPDQLAKVFDMFAQVERTNERVQGGLGIGLNIVKHLVEMHDGRIDVRSGGLRGGSTFSVVLPLARHVHTSTQPETVRTGATTSRMRILIVDDNEDAATMMSLLLGHYGHDLRVAHNGQQALAIGAEIKPDLVLMDIGMPVMDGNAACLEMKRTPWGRAAYVVALTGLGQDEDRMKSTASGFDHHLVKPVASEALMKVLTACAQRRSAAAGP